MNRKALESLKANQLKDALVQVEQALAEDPQFYSAYSNKALVLGKMGRYADAAQTLDQALEVKPDFSLAHLFRGIYLEKAGDTAAANASYRKAVEGYDLELTREDPTPEKAVHRAIAMYLLRGKTLGLREIFAILEQYPSYVAAARLRDRMLADDRDFFMWWLTDVVAESE
jgi:tetratricopeptide (TPR) repeat protein